MKQDIQALANLIRRTYLLRQGEHYKSIGRHDLAGPIFAELNMFPEFDYIEG